MKKTHLEEIGLHAAKLGDGGEQIGKVSELLASMDRLRGTGKTVKWVGLYRDIFWGSVPLPILLTRYEEAPTFYPFKLTRGRK